MRKIDKIRLALAFPLITLAGFILTISEIISGKFTKIVVEDTND
jgi:hypothetical protein